jgi:hypothetical protein
MAWLKARPAWLRALPETLRTSPGRLRGWWGLRTATWSADRPLVTGAVYRQGALHLDESLSLPEETHLRLVVEDEALAPRPLSLSLRRWWWATLDLLRMVAQRIPFDKAIFAAVIVIYLLTRLVALDRFPIYFMADEASQTLYAQQLVEQGFRDQLGILFPVYVEAQALDLLDLHVPACYFCLFGKSVFITAPPLPGQPAGGDLVS